jgi:hypothetical protein
LLLYRQFKGDTGCHVAINIPSTNVVCFVAQVCQLMMSVVNVYIEFFGLLIWPFVCLYGDFIRRVVTVCERVLDIYMSSDVWAVSMSETAFAVILFKGLIINWPLTAEILVASEKNLHSFGFHTMM